MIVTVIDIVTIVIVVSVFSLMICGRVLSTESDVLSLGHGVTVKV